MRIIISLAKQIRVNSDTFAWNTLPVFMEKTEILIQWIQRLSYEEQKKLWACNDKIPGQNAERFANMDLRQNLTPALLSYDGEGHIQRWPGEKWCALWQGSWQKLRSRYYNQDRSSDNEYVFIRIEVPGKGKK